MPGEARLDGEDPSESVARYLAKQCMARQNFAPATQPEVSALASPGDIVLTRVETKRLVILIIIDRETFPNRRFDIPPSHVEAVGQACRKYVGQQSLMDWPVVIRVIEVTNQPVRDEERKRLADYAASPFSRIAVCSTIISTYSNYIWSTGATPAGAAEQRFLETILREPRTSVPVDLPLASVATTPPGAPEAAPEAETVLPAPIAEGPRRFPFLTCLILALLVLVFAGEVVFAVRPPTGALQADIETLIALGGLNRTLVLQKGEWYRVLTAPLMHGDQTHIISNGIALLIAGNMLERLVGRAWFGTLFVVGALGGSLMSLAVDPADLVSVGASGAIMGLCAGVLAISFHLPPGPDRAKLRGWAIYILIPSLLPFATRSGIQVDYAAHFGGAIAGAVVGFVLLRLWPRAEIWPRFRQAAFVVCSGGALLALACFVPLALNYSRYTLVRLLAPNHQFAGSEQDPRTVAAAVTRDFPRDPRGHLLQARVFITSGNLDGAERELRTGLSEQDILKSALEPVTEASLRMLLAAVLYDKRQFDEAKAIGKPACTMASTPQVRGVLDKLKLCD